MNTTTDQNTYAGLQLPPTPEQSMFDALKRTDQHGNEYWSARDLAPLMGYSRWQTFEVPLNRAMTAARNQGHDVESHFTRSSKMVNRSQGGGMEQQDFHLTRFAAYLVAMNGDPNKAEVAAAQAYFAIQTRVAETAHQAPKSLEQQALEVLTALQAKVNEQARELEVARPMAEESRQFRSATGLETIGDVANRLKLWADNNAPAYKVLHKDVFDLAGELGIIIRGNTIRNNQPTARAIEYGWAKTQTHSYERNNGETEAKIYTRLTHKGAGRIWDTAVNRIQAGVPLFVPKSTAPQEAGLF